MNYNINWTQLKYNLQDIGIIIHGIFIFGTIVLEMIGPFICSIVYEGICVSKIGWFCSHQELHIIFMIIRILSVRMLNSDISMLLVMEGMALVIWVPSISMRCFQESECDLCYMREWLLPHLAFACFYVPIIWYVCLYCFCDGVFTKKEPEPEIESDSESEIESPPRFIQEFIKQKEKEEVQNADVVDVPTAHVISKV